MFLSIIQWPVCSSICLSMLQTLSTYSELATSQKRFPSCFSCFLLKFSIQDREWGVRTSWPKVPQVQPGSGEGCGDGGQLTAQRDQHEAIDEGAGCFPVSDACMPAWKNEALCCFMALATSTVIGTKGFGCCFGKSFVKSLQRWRESSGQSWSPTEAGSGEGLGTPGWRRRGCPAQGRGLSGTPASGNDVAHVPGAACRSGPMGARPEPRA